jgi:hypothetical protein
MEKSDAWTHLMEDDLADFFALRHCRQRDEYGEGDERRQGCVSVYSFAALGALSFSLWRRASYRLAADQPEACCPRFLTSR